MDEPLDPKTVQQAEAALDWEARLDQLESEHLRHVRWLESDSVPEEPRQGQES